MKNDSGLTIRRAKRGDDADLARLLMPVIRAGETYPLPRHMSSEAAIAYWQGEGRQVFLATGERETVGTYYLRANHQGGGDHVANCGYIVAEGARGEGIASALCTHSLRQARLAGFAAMQFNFVVSSNTQAVHLWSRHGFAIVGRLPGAFMHPTKGAVDALVMYRTL